jgi:hypothetical protein
MTKPLSMNELQTIAKVLGLALGLSLLIKYGLSTLPIPMEDGQLALVIVLLPTVVMAIWLTVKYWTVAGRRATSHEE